MLDKRQPGRPRGRTEARDRILAAARTRFVEHGYAGTTIRALAADAGFDVATVAYHFGSKSALFATAMALSPGPSQAMTSALSGSPDQIPQRVTTALIHAWEDPVSGPALRAFALAALHHEDVLAAFQEYLDREIYQPLVGLLGGRSGPDRALSVLTILTGIVMSRYIMKMDAATSLDAERYTSVIAQTMGAAIRAEARPCRLPA